MAIDEDKIRLIEEIQAEKLRQRTRVLLTFIPGQPEATPFQEQIDFFKDKSLSKIVRAGNRAAKTFTTMRDLAFKVTRTHWYRQDYNVFHIKDKKWADKIDSDEFEARYLKTKPEMFWLVGPTYEFVNTVLWDKYLAKMIPDWFISEIKYTNQKNLESVIFKNGDVIKCKTYSQQDTTKMGFVVNGVYVDEMPNDAKTITELVVRTFDCDGQITLGFTPLVENPEVKEYIDNSCTSGVMSLHSWTIFQNPHYSQNPDRMRRVLAEYANLPENERNARLSGAWYFNKPDKPVFEGLELEVVEDFHIPPEWRQVRFTDPASHVTGHAIFAEDPSDGVWYLTKGVEFTWGHIVKASDIIEQIEALKPYEDFKYLLSVYDNAEAWFGAESRSIGYEPCILKNREAAIMMTRNAVADKKVKVFRVGGAVAITQFEKYHYNKDGIKIVRKKDHVLDCLMYFCRQIPKPLLDPSKQKTEAQEMMEAIIARTEAPPRQNMNPFKNRSFTSSPMVRNLRSRGIR